MEINETKLKLIDTYDEFGQEYSYFVDEYGDKVNNELANQMISDMFNYSSDNSNDRRLLLINR